VISLYGLQPTKTTKKDITMKFLKLVLFMSILSFNASAFTTGGYKPPPKAPEQPPLIQQLLDILNP